MSYAKLGLSDLTIPVKVQYMRRLGAGVTNNPNFLNPSPSGAEINEAKKMLATEATALVHGRAEAERAADTARRTFEEGTLAEALPTIELGRAAARLLLRRLEKGPAVAPAVEVLQPRLVVRGSTGPAPKRPSAGLRSAGIVRASLMGNLPVGIRPLPDDTVGLDYCVSALDPGAREDTT